MCAKSGSAIFSKEGGESILSEELLASLLWFELTPEEQSSRLDLEVNNQPNWSRARTTTMFMDSVFRVLKDSEIRHAWYNNPRVETELGQFAENSLHFVIALAASTILQMDPDPPPYPENVSPDSLVQFLAALILVIPFWSIDDLDLAERRVGDVISTRGAGEGEKVFTQKCLVLLSLPQYATGLLATGAIGDHDPYRLLASILGRLIILVSDQELLHAWFANPLLENSVRDLALLSLVG